LLQAGQVYASGWLLNPYQFTTEEPASLLTDADVLGVWRFENDLTDSSSVGNALSESSAVSYETATPTPPNGTYSLHLSGNYVYDTGTDYNVTGAFSFGGWFYFDADTDGFFGGRHGGGNYGWVLRRFAANDNIEFGISSDGSSWSSGVSGNDVIVAATWYHVVCVYTGTAKKIYIDGSEYTGGDFPQAYSSGVYNPPVPFDIGYVDYGGDSLVGNVKDAFFFKRALSAAEISTIYTSGF